ncbi:MAG: hypothetical protein KC609_13265 [Myxococcales bacterium]|nr:hypothetical protein [Myxococcales bacterium]
MTHPQAPKPARCIGVAAFVESDPREENRRDPPSGSGEITPTQQALESRARSARLADPQQTPGGIEGASVSGRRVDEDRGDERRKGDQGDERRKRGRTDQGSGETLLQWFSTQAFGNG